MSASMMSFANGARSANEFHSIDAFLDSCQSLTSSFAAADSGDGAAYLSSSTLGRLPSLPPKARRKRVGRAADLGPLEDNSAIVMERRPRLFGGSLEEYVEATGEEIPLIIRSCIRMLSMYGLHHQGVFRVSGSQVEINAFKDSFEKGKHLFLGWLLHICDRPFTLGEDPLMDVTDASDVNSVAGVLKLYFRELLEPLFPMFMFDQFVECTSKYCNYCYHGSDIEGFWFHCRSRKQSGSDTEDQRSAENVAKTGVRRHAVSVWISEPVSPCFFD